MDQKKLISNIIKASQKIVKNSIYGSASYIFKYDYKSLKSLLKNSINWI